LLRTVQARPAAPLASELEENAQWCELGKLIGKLDGRLLPAALAYVRQIAQEGAAS
jgi:hypothetical protein